MTWLIKIFYTSSNIKFFTILWYFIATKNGRTKTLFPPPLMALLLGPGRIKSGINIPDPAPLQKSKDHQLKKTTRVASSNWIFVSSYTRITSQYSPSRLPSSPPFAGASAHSWTRSRLLLRSRHPLHLTPRASEKCISPPFVDRYNWCNGFYMLAALIRRRFLMADAMRKGDISPVSHREESPAMWPVLPALSRSFRPVRRKNWTLSKNVLPSLPAVVNFLKAF